MGISADFSAMNRAIVDYCNAHIPKDPNKAHIGTIQGKRVAIDNKSFQFVPTVDMYFGNGDRVACILPNNSNHAAIVGVF